MPLSKTELRDRVDRYHPELPNPLRLYNSPEMHAIGATVDLYDAKDLVRLRRALRDAAYYAHVERQSLPPDEARGKRKRWIENKLVRPMERLEKTIMSLITKERRRLVELTDTDEHGADAASALGDLMCELGRSRAELGGVMSYLSQPLQMKPQTEYRYALVFALMDVFKEFFPEIRAGRINDGERTRGPCPAFIRAAARPALGGYHELNAEIQSAVSYYRSYEKNA